MYAVIETGGKQYKVAVGDKLKVEKLDDQAGASINLARVLMVADGDKVMVGTPTLDTPVSATVLSHGKGDKIRVFKMKRRKNYRRTQGHRQLFTEIEITRIGAARKPAQSAAAKKAPATKRAGKTAKPNKPDVDAA